MPIVFALAGDSTITSDFPAPPPNSSGGAVATERLALALRAERVVVDLPRVALRALLRGAALFRGAAFFAVLLAVFFLAAI